MKKTFHGDEWVSIEIEVQDGKIKHYADGVEVLSASNARYNPEHEFGKKFAAANGGIIKEGFVSLQSNSHPIDFRKIELLEK